MPIWVTVLITVLDLILAIAAVVGVWRKIEKKLLDNHTAQQKRDADIQEALKGVRMCPTYREQNKTIQEGLEANDKKLLETCEKIQQGVDRNQDLLNERLDKLEKRERNALREKIISLYRMFTNTSKNPLQKWSEMERDSFFHLVGDYEDLGGNDYVHSTVLPAMNNLEVVLMADLESLEELMHSRQS